MKFDLEQHHIFYFYIYDLMSRTEKNICLAYCYFFEQALMGEYQQIFPSIPKLAQIAKCCPRSVNKFIKKYETKLFHHKKYKDKETKRNKSNRYCLNQDFFEFICLLKMANLVHKWEKVKKKIEIGISEEPFYLCSYLYEKGQLSTTKMRSDHPQKMRCIKSFFSYQILLKKVPRTEPAIKAVVQRKAFEEINDLPLSFSDKERLSVTFSILSLREARKDFLFYSNKHKVDTPIAFMHSRAKAHTIEQLKL